MPKSSDVRQAISEWYSSGDDLLNQYQLLRTAHAHILEHLEDTIPALHLVSVNKVMKHHPTSKFPFDQAALLADPAVEGRLAVYLIRMEFVSSQARNLIREPAKLIELVELSSAG